MRLIFLAGLCLAAAGASTATLPLAFESHGAFYIARGAGYAMTLAADQAALHWDAQSVQIQLVGADARARLEGLGRMPGHVTYLLGTTNGATYTLYGQVLCRSAYPGIDVLYRGDRQRLEYDFHLAPRADVDAIVLAFTGADRPEIDSSGDLILHAGTRTIRQPKPLAWQILAGARHTISVEYRKLGCGHIGFRLAPHDPALPLIIDPAIIFDTLFGGSGGSIATGIALDKQGNIYVAGSTSSPNFNLMNPAQGRLGTAPMLTSLDGGKTWNAESVGSATSINTVVTAPNSPSTLYANAGQGVFQSTDSGATWKQPANLGLTASFDDLSVDAGSSSTLYACNGKGIFLSTDAGNSWQPSNSGINVYEGFSAAQCYAIRANPARPGVVFYSAYNPTGLYRSLDYGKTWTAINTGAAYESVDTIAFTPGSPDSLIAGQMGGTLLVSGDDGDTWAPKGSQSVANNHCLVMDPTNAANFFLCNGAGVQKSTDGGNTWSVVLPNPNPSTPSAGILAIDNGHVYAFNNQGLFISSDGGQTWVMATTPYPVMPGSLYVAPDGSRILLGTQSAGDVFVTKWDPTGTQVLYSTYLGGSGGDSAVGVAVDSAGSAYVAGTTSSLDFPVTASALQKNLVGDHNIFAAKLSQDGSKFVYSTLFGGGNEFASGFAVDPAGTAYLAGSVTSGLPVSGNAFQKSPGAGNCPQPYYLNYPTSGDALVAKISPDGASLIYASYLGGECGDRATGIAANADGSAWIVGATYSPDFPVTADALQPDYGSGFGDGFIARVSATGALAYATYVGGPDYDEIDALALDSSGNIYLTGSSVGFAQSASAGAFQPTVSTGCIFLGFGVPLFNPNGNAFVMKMDPAAKTVTGLTYIGSPCSAVGTAIALDPAGAIWIAGTPSNIFPTANPLRIQAGDAFVSQFSPDLTQLLFSTYFDAVGGLAVDPSGMALVAGSASSPAQAYIAKIDATPAAISLSNVASASPFYTAALPLSAVGIAPGKIVRLVGKGMGPPAETPGVVSGGVISGSVAGVQVTFDGVPAPLLYVGSNEIECIVPFEVAGQAMTTIQVTYNGAKSNAMAVPVHPSATEVLAVLNADFSLNSPDDPARAGSIVTLYITGAGQTNPASTTGQVYANPLPLPTGSVTVFSSGVQFPVTYAAAAYGLAAGIVQVNFQSPAVNPNGVVSATANGSFGYFTVTVK